MSLSANIILTFKIYKGEIDLSLPDFILRSPKPGLRWHTCHVDEESALFLYICEILEQLPASVII